LKIAAKAALVQPALKFYCKKYSPCFIYKSGSKMQRVNERQISH